MLEMMLRGQRFYQYLKTMSGAVVRRSVQLLFVPGIHITYIYTRREIFMMSYLRQRNRSALLCCVMHDDTDLRVDMNTTQTCTSLSCPFFLCCDNIDFFCPALPLGDGAGCAGKLYWSEVR